MKTWLPGIEVAEARWRGGLHAGPLDCRSALHLLRRIAGWSISRLWRPAMRESKPLLKSSWRYLWHTSISFWHFCIILDNVVLDFFAKNWTTFRNLGPRSEIQEKEQKEKRKQLRISAMIWPRFWPRSCRDLATAKNWCESNESRNQRIQKPTNPESNTKLLLSDPTTSGP